MVANFTQDDDEALLESVARHDEECIVIDGIGDRLCFRLGFKYIWIYA